MTVIPLFADRFRVASRYYLNGRPTYPPLLVKRVAALIGLTRSDLVLDLGTGPGFLAVAFAPYAKAVTAVDPSPEMLDVARENAARARANVTVVQGSSFELGPALGRFKLVTIGRAFHWMDRATTLTALDGLVDPPGAIALFASHYPDVPENAWQPGFQEIVSKYTVDDPAKPWTRPAHKHEAVLLESAFNAIERIGVLERRVTPLESFVDRALSFASAWVGAPGSRTDDLAGEIREAMAKYAENGIVREVIEGEALIARRS